MADFSFHELLSIVIITFSEIGGRIFQQAEFKLQEATWHLANSDRWRFAIKLASFQIKLACNDYITF